MAESGEETVRAKRPRRWKRFALLLIVLAAAWATIQHETGVSPGGWAIEHARVAYAIFQAERTIHPATLDPSTPASVPGYRLVAVTCGKDEYGIRTEATVLRIE